MIANLFSINIPTGCTQHSTKPSLMGRLEVNNFCQIWNFVQSCMKGGEGCKAIIEIWILEKNFSKMKSTRGEVSWKKISFIFHVGIFYEYMLICTFLKLYHHQLPIHIEKEKQFISNRMYSQGWAGLVRKELESFWRTCDSDSESKIFPKFFNYYWFTLHFTIYTLGLVTL